MAKTVISYPGGKRHVNGVPSDGPLRGGRLQEILDSRQAPGIRTNDTLVKGFGTLSQQFGDDRVLKFYVGEAKRHGYTPSANDAYLPQLADFPGDPKAFVKHGDASTHIRKVCEEKGVSCSGAVTVKGREADPAADVPVADDIAERMVEDAVAADPSLRGTDRRELKEAVVDKHGAK